MAGSGSALPVPPGRPSALRRLLGYVSLAVKLVLFALVFVLAVKNSEPVTLRFFLGREVETSLALARAPPFVKISVYCVGGHHFGRQISSGPMG